MSGPQQQEPRDLGRELLNEIKLRLPSSVTPEEAVRSVMGTFGQHLSREDSRRVLQLLPASLRPWLERRKLHRDHVADRLDRDEFVVRIADHLGISISEAGTVTAAVLEGVSARLPKGEVKALARQLPAHLRELWTTEPPAERHPLFLAIERSVLLPHGVTGERAMMYVCCTLTRRLGKREARQLADGLPQEVRPLLATCLGARAEPAEHFSRRELLEHVGKDLHTADSEPIVRAVLKVVKSYLSTELIEQVKAQLPEDLKEIWHDPEGAPRTSFH